MAVSQTLFFAVACACLGLAAFLTPCGVGVSLSFNRTVATVPRRRAAAQAASYAATLAGVFAVVGAAAGGLGALAAPWPAGVAGAVSLGLAPAYGLGRTAALERPLGVNLGRFGFGTLGGVLGSAGFGCRFALALPGCVAPFALAATVHAAAAGGTAAGALAGGLFGAAYAAPVAAAALSVRVRARTPALARRSVALRPVHVLLFALLGAGSLYWAFA